MIKHRIEVGSLGFFERYNCSDSIGSEHIMTVWLELAGVHSPFYRGLDTAPNVSGALPRAFAPTAKPQLKPCGTADLSAIHQGQMDGGRNDYSSEKSLLWWKCGNALRS